MTEKLYYINAYTKSFNAKVISCEKTNDGYAVVLDKTAFFPTGGGQSSDTGFIGTSKVLEVKEIDGEIYHFVSEPQEVGGEALCNIDFDARFEKMQLHTAEHIVSGIIHSSFELNNVGFHLGSDVVTLDIDGVLTREQLNFVEDTANMAVFENIAVECRIISDSEIKTLDYRSKLELAKDVRVVTVPGYDSCACCAPHVSRTGEIGIIKILDFIKYKGGVRINMLAGRRALMDYRTKFQVLQSISADLSAPPHECDAEVKRVLKDSAKKDLDLRAEKAKIAGLIADAVEATEGNRVVNAPDLSHDELRIVATSAVARVGGILVAVSGDEGNYKYVIASSCIDLKQQIANINKALNGKGGGRPEMAQGSFNCTISQIKEYFEA